MADPRSRQDHDRAEAASGREGGPEADRRAKLDRLRAEFGVDPFGEAVDGLIPLAEARSLYSPEADETRKADASAGIASDTADPRPVVRVAGRIVQKRVMGNLIFMGLRDGSGDLQVAVSKKAVDRPAFNMAKLADLSDIVAVAGPLGKTKTGEITAWAEGDGGFRIAAKSLAPPPEKYHGLRDAELRYRRRYVDLYANPDVMATFRKRSEIVRAVRDFLTAPPDPLGPGYLEVETPMMQPIAGGAAARPFITHHNALDIDLYLRIAPELYLKRLLVGGMSRVFEINRNFRNEGIDRSHNPEFTMLELYQAFGDYRTMTELTETLVHTLAVETGSDPLSLEGEGRGEGELFSPRDEGHFAVPPAFDPHPSPLPARERGPLLPYGDHEIDYATPFRRAKYHDLFAEHAGFDASDHDRLVGLAGERGIEHTGKDHDVLLNEVWEAIVEPHLVQPTFVIDYPASLCPLTKTKAGNPDIAERFELFIAGMEIANAYTELNDPDAQRANFQNQAAGLDEEESTFRAMDEDFLEALRVGMPPAGGLGVGVDRLVMLLTNARSIRDVILFPLMKPVGKGLNHEDTKDAKKA